MASTLHPSQVWHLGVPWPILLSFCLSVFPSSWYFTLHGLPTWLRLLTVWWSLNSDTSYVVASFEREHSKSKSPKTPGQKLQREPWESVTYKASPESKTGYHMTCAYQEMRFTGNTARKPVTVVYRPLTKNSEIRKKEFIRSSNQKPVTKFLINPTYTR